MPILPNPDPAVQTTFVTQIFTSEDVELPRDAVADYLEGVSLQLCAKYLVFIIVERNEESPHFHDRLAELYLDMTLREKKAGKGWGTFATCFLNLTPSPASWKELYAKFLEFISSDPKIQVDRLYGLTSGSGKIVVHLLVIHLVIHPLTRPPRSSCHSLGKVRKTRSGFGNVCVSIARLSEGRGVSKYLYYYCVRF